ncbi:MAG: hypothetical protein EB141_07050 [Verrucomicrobia bacterium]|nr:hypothetical protein [Verrucomicrobiota bacterium]
MKLLRSILLFTTAFAFVASAQAAPADKSENAKLEGTWVGGVRSPAGKAKDGSATMVQISELTIKDGRITSCKDGKGLSLGNCESLALNPASKTLDATGDSKNGKKGVFQGIYRVNGDKLEWCAANPGIARPKDFFTTPQVQFHMVFDKKK